MCSPGAHFFAQYALAVYLRASCVLAATPRHTPLLYTTPSLPLLTFAIYHPSPPFGQALLDAQITSPSYRPLPPSYHPSPLLLPLGQAFLDAQIRKQEARQWAALETQLEAIEQQAAIVK